MSLMMQPRCANMLRSRPQRRGSALVYLTSAMVALLAFASLAVDVGHVYVVKSELLLAADAAARYGVTGLESGVSTAQSHAVDAANDNMADGTAVVIDPATDVEFLRWNKSDRTYVVLSGATRSTANALRVTARRTSASGGGVQLLFARVLGKTSQDVQASAIAYIEDRRPSGIIGLNGITFNNNAFIGSYNSSANTNPSESTSSSNGSIGSNGAITGGTNNNLRGGVTLGPLAPSATGITVSGATVRLTSALVGPADPPWTPAPNPNGVPQNYTASGNVTLPGGTYWFTSISVRGSLRFSGPATLNVNGPIMVSGSLQPVSLIPGDLRINQLGNNSFNDDDFNGMDIVADIVAPGADFQAKNNFSFRGRMIVGTIHIWNNADFYYDLALGGTGLGRSIVTVR